MGRCVGITVWKGCSRVGARTGTLKNPTKCLWRWEPDRRSYFFFSPPAHLCAVTYMTEISLIVTLNKQFNSTQLQLFDLISMVFQLFLCRLDGYIYSIFVIYFNCISHYVDFNACFFQGDFSANKWSSDISNWVGWLRSSDSREIYVCCWYGKFSVNQDQE